MSDRWNTYPYSFGLLDQGNGNATWPDGQPAVPTNPAFPAAGTAPPVHYLVPLYGADLLDPEPIYPADGGSVQNVPTLGIDLDPVLVPYIAGPPPSPYHSWGSGATWSGGLAEPSPSAATPQSAPSQAAPSQMASSHSASSQSVWPDASAASPLTNGAALSQLDASARVPGGAGTDMRWAANSWADPALWNSGLAAPPAAAGMGQTAWPQSPSIAEPSFDGSSFGTQPREASPFDASSIPPMAATAPVPFLDPTAFDPSGLYDPSRNANADEPGSRLTQGGRNVGNYQVSSSDAFTGIRQPSPYGGWQSAAPWDVGLTTAYPAEREAFEKVWPEPSERTSSLVWGGAGITYLDPTRIWSDRAAPSDADGTSFGVDFSLSPVPEAPDWSTVPAGAAGSAEFLPPTSLSPLAWASPVSSDRAEAAAQSADRKRGSALTPHNITQSDVSVQPPAGIIPSPDGHAQPDPTYYDRFADAVRQAREWFVPEPTLGNDLMTVMSVFPGGARIRRVPRVSKKQPYTVIAEIKLRSTSYPGKSRQHHNQEANEMVLQKMESRKSYAKKMADSGVKLQRTSTGLAPRTSPKGKTWHHDLKPGVMQLISRAQHRSKRLQKYLHKDGKGGFSTWGK